ncbi:MAG: hypothetical protein AAGF97_14765, partial [Planctomycetota bacterium]
SVMNADYSFPVGSVMILEKQIVPLLEWLQSSWLVALQVVGILAVLGLVIAYLITAARLGPAEAFRSLGTVLRSAVRDLRDFSLRRTLAVATLAVKESLRSYSLIVFAIFVLILLLAGWYLDARSDNPARLYISFVLKSGNFLILLLAIFLSAFSLPNDVKSKTIFTVVTKPVRPWEMILGRILGFAFVGTCILSLMCLISFFFVKRGLHHRHEVELASVVERDTGGWMGTTTQNAFHRHEFATDEDGNGATDARMGHAHAVTREGTGDDAVWEVGPPQGALEARVPIYGKLRFLDRAGRPGKGINVGKEWTYRGYVEGRTLSAGIWRFQNLNSREFPDVLPMETTLRVFRTYKGEIERGILGTLRFVNTNPEVLESAKTRDPELLQMYTDSAVESEPFTFYAQEFTPESRDIPRKIRAKMVDGSTREVDLFEALVTDGEVDVKVQCEERGQYYGMAQPDLYIRASDKLFWVNFVKSYVTLWLQMVVVTSFGVMFSTFLTGSVAMLATLGAMVIGYFSNLITGVASGELEGGGPIEAMVRMVKQENLMTDLDLGVGKIIMRTFDTVSLLVMQAVSYVMPNFRDYAEYGGINTARFVASGFDIPNDLMIQHAIVCLLYVVIATCAGYFFFKSKEIAG